MLDGRELRVQMARYGRPTSPYRRRRRRYNFRIIIVKLFNFTALYSASKLNVQQTETSNMNTTHTLIVAWHNKSMCKIKNNEWFFIDS